MVDRLLCLFVLMLTVPTCGLAAPPEAVNDTVTMDSTGAYSATGGWGQDFYEPSLRDTATLSDSRIGFTWLSSGDVRVLFRQRDGFQTGAEFVAGSDASETPAITGVTSGGFVVAWVGADASSPGTAPDILARRYNSANTALGAAFRVNTSTTGDQTDAIVVGLSGGGFVVVWATATDFRARFYDAAGLAVSGEVIVNTNPIGGASLLEARALDDGGIVVAWAINNEVRTRGFAAAGVEQSPERSFLMTSTGTLRDRVLLDGGGVAFLSDLAIAPGQRRAQFEMFDSRGRQLRPPQFIGTASSGFVLFGPLRMGALQDGNLLVSLSRYGSGSLGGGYWEVFVLDHAGNQITALSPPKHALVDRINPFVTALEDERFLLSYQYWNGSDFYRAASVYEAGFLSAEELYTFNITVNDRDFAGSPLEITDIAGLGHAGTVSLPSGATVQVSDGAVTYDPRSAPFAVGLGDGEVGFDSFAYTISNGSETDTANVMISLVGVGNPPVAANDNLAFGQNESQRDVTVELLANDTDPDTGDSGQLSVTGLNPAGTQGQASYNAGTVTYSPGGAFLSLPEGQAGSDSFIYAISDPDGLTATATANVTVNGANDAPTAMNDAIPFSEEEGPRNITFNLLFNDTDPDTGESDQLTVTAIDTTGTQGSVDLTNGQVHYSPNGAFNSLSEGQTATDSFGYTVSDPGGLPSSATMTVTINGFDGYTLTAAVDGLGSGSVANLNLTINCGNGGSACSSKFEQNTNVELYATPANGSRFDGWSGACTGTGPCIVSMTMAQSVTARFELSSPQDGRIVAATLPGARSGYVGGPDLTAYMTVVSRATTPAQDCRIAASGSAPFAFTYRQLDGSNQPAGPTDPRFDLGNGQSMSFVLVMAPQTATGASGYAFQPQVACDNADLATIPGVNTVLVSIGNAPVPDILSIGVTVSGDGVVRIPSSGNRISFMSAAAMNIGAGDGSGGTNDATVTVSVDTGAATLPVTLEVCETNASGSCTTPRGQTSLSTVFSGSTARTFAVFVRANEGAFVPFDPANSRVYLRFTDATGTLRSVTSAAISAPAG